MPITTTCCDEFFKLWVKIDALTTDVEQPTKMIQLLLLLLEHAETMGLRAATPTASAAPLIGLCNEIMYLGLPSGSGAR
jgi:hypothetical protein